MRAPLSILLLTPVALFGCERAGTDPIGPAAPLAPKENLALAGLVVASVGHTQFGEQSFNSSRVAAAFGLRNLGCQYASIDGCALASCSLGDGAPHFGALSLSSANRSLLLEPSGDGEYSAVDDVSRVAKSGDKVTIRGFGGPNTLGSFDSTLALPGDMVVSKLSGSSAWPFPNLKIDVTRDLSLTWPMAKAPSQVAVAISAKGETTTAELVCPFAGNTGMGTASAAALAALPKGNGRLRAGAASTQRIATSELAVDWVLINTATVEGTNGVVPASLAIVVE